MNDSDTIYYVIQFDNGSYWTGYNNYSTQIRQARIYTSLKHCREAAEDCMKRSWINAKFTKSYKIIEITINIIGEHHDE